MYGGHRSGHGARGEFREGTSGRHRGLEPARAAGSAGLARRQRGACAKTCPAPLSQFGGGWGEPTGCSPRRSAPNIKCLTSPAEQQGEMEGRGSEVGPENRPSLGGHLPPQRAAPYKPVREVPARARAMGADARSVRALGAAEAPPPPPVCRGSRTLRTAALSSRGRSLPLVLLTWSREEADLRCREDGPPPYPGVLCPLQEEPWAAPSVPWPPWWTWRCPMT